MLDQWDSSGESILHFLSLYMYLSDGNLHWTHGVTS